ncbi:MAG: hypothetical protein RQM90_00340 [Methanoculleus sp.]
MLQTLQENRHSTPASSPSTASRSCQAMIEHLLDHPGVIVVAGHEHLIATIGGIFQELTAKKSHWRK